MAETLYIGSSLEAIEIDLEKKLDGKGPSTFIFISTSSFTGTNSLVNISPFISIYSILTNSRIEWLRAVALSLKPQYHFLAVATKG